MELTISARALLRMRRESYLLIDVRETALPPEGQRQGVLYRPYSQIEVWSRQLPRGKTIICLCERGSLSLQAAGRLRQLGFDARSVVGGSNLLERVEKQLAESQTS